MYSSRVRSWSYPGGSLLFPACHCPVSVSVAAAPSVSVHVSAVAARQCASVLVSGTARQCQCISVVRATQCGTLLLYIDE
jgi:hypothetical protein